MYFKSFNKKIRNLFVSKERHISFCFQCNFDLQFFIRSYFGSYDEIRFRKKTTESWSMKRSKSLSYKGKKHIPLPTGQYTVGCTDIMTSSKCGVFFRLYYPAEPTGDRDHFLEWPLWVPSRHYVDGYARKSGICRALVRWYFSLCIGNVYIPALWNAAIAKNGTKFPIIVFSHGLGGWRNVYSTICLELASHGFVVAALEHRDQSALATPYLKNARMSICGQFPGASLEHIDEILDRHSESEWKSAIIDEWNPKPLPQSVGPHSYLREWINYLNVSKTEEKYVRKSQLLRRAQECIQVFDCLQALNNGNLVNALEPNYMESQFLGHFDLTKAAVAGHSFGGATTILSLGMESRFKLGIALDPWMLPFFEDQTAFAFIEQPLLTVTTSTFQDEQSLNIMQKLLKEGSERIFLSIKHSKHTDQTDLPFIGCAAVPLLSGITLDKFNAVDVSVHLMLAFLEKHLGITVTSCTDVQRNWYKSKCDNIF